MFGGVGERRVGPSITEWEGGGREGVDKFLVICKCKFGEQKK